MTNSKIIKFTASNLIAMILMVFILIGQFTVYGLIAYIVGSALLFLGTLLDKKKSLYGITGKLAYTIWICLLTITVIHLSAIVPVFTPTLAKVENTNFPGLIISLIIWISCLVMYHNKRFYHYVLRRILKYAALLFFFLSVYFFWGISLYTFIQTLIVTVAFMFIDIYNCKVAMSVNQDFVDTNRDRAYWMVASLNAVLLLVSLLFNKYALVAFDPQFVLNVLIPATSGYTAPLFCGLAIALAAICKLLYTKKEYFTYLDISDCYFVLSLGGFFLLLSVYFANRTDDVGNKILSLIIFALALTAYIIFGFSIPSADSGSKKNPIYYCLRFSKDSGIISSLAITALAVPGIIFVTRGYIVPILFFIIGATISVVSFVLLKSSWVKKAISWQILLVCILAYLISLGGVNNNLHISLPFTITLFIVCSISEWCLGVREDIHRTKLQTVMQAAVSGVFLLSGILAAGQFMLPTLNN